MQHSWRQVASMLVIAWEGSRALSTAVFGPPLALLLDAVIFVSACCLPVLQVGFNNIFKMQRQPLPCSKRDFEALGCMTDSKVCSDRQCTSCCRFTSD